MKSLENKIRTTLNATNLGGISYQEINFIRHHLNLELSELDKSSWLDVKLHNAPNEHDLIFQSKKETDLITFQGPSKYKVNVNRPDEEWNSLHTLQAYSLLTHELGHFMQSTLSKEISNRSYQLSHLYLAPKFLV